MKAAKAVITSQRYKLPIDQKDMESLMRECYELEVKSRGREPSIDTGVLRNISKISRWATDQSTKSSLLLFGGIGNGKTTLAKALRRAMNVISYTAKNCSEIIGNVQKAHPLSLVKTPPFISAQQIVDDTLSDESKSNLLLNSEMIIIDDLGCEPVTSKVYGTETTPIVDIIRSRYDNQKSTVITTNLDLNGIEQRYGARILDRMKETFEMIAFESKSYRS